MAIYLQFGNAKGSVTADGYAGRIAVYSAKLAVRREVSMESGNLSNREPSKPALSQITIVKKMDNSEAALFKAALTGAAGQEAVLVFVHTGSGKLEEFMTYKLSHCIISKYSIAAKSDESPVVTLTLSYSAIEVSYKDRDATGKAGSPQRVAYDVSAAKAA